MELTYKHSVFSVSATGDAMFMITIPKSESHLYDKVRAFEDDKLKVMTIDYHREKRTLTANSYLWVLVQKLSKVLNIPKGDMYIKLIKMYGQFHQPIIRSDAKDSFIRQWDIANTEVEHTESLCEITSTWKKGDVEWFEINAHCGSSTYSKYDFKTLLDGVVDECKIQNIDTMTPQEIQSLIDKMEEQ